MLTLFLTLVSTTPTIFLYQKIEDEIALIPRFMANSRKVTVL